MGTKKQKLPKYGRVANPPAMRLTERDTLILEAIHTYDGILSFSQIQRMFFTGKSQAEERLKLLYQNKYLNRPDESQRRRLNEMIYWLDRNGADLIASRQGIPLGELGWRQEPRWFQVDHDLAVNDFRLTLRETLSQTTNVTMETWIPESEFWAYPDTITYPYNGQTIKRKIIPDGFFVLSHAKLRIRYLLEIDRSTEDNPRFLREKILPGLAYLKTEAYENRFGHRSGRWIVVTTGERRMKNMLLQARHAKAGGLFYFTTFSQVTVENILSSPIWHRADREQAVPLIFVDEE
jgi:hypothetical protein